MAEQAVVPPAEQEPATGPELAAVPEPAEAVVDARQGPPSLVARLAAAMSEAAEVTKSSKNTEQNYMFASAEAILAAVRGPLLTRGIILTQQPREYVTTEILSSNNKKGDRIVAVLDFTFRDGITGETFTVEGWRGVGQDYGDKAIGKAYTNAVKTFIRAQWLLPTEHDDPEASPSGDRAANGPSYAMADDATKAAMLEVLKRLVGHGPTAGKYAKTLADKMGGMPAPVAAWLVTLPQWREAGQAERGREEAAQEAGAQDTAAEAAVDDGPDPTAAEPDGGTQTFTTADPEAAAKYVRGFDEAKLARWVESQTDPVLQNAAVCEQSRRDALKRGLTDADGGTVPEPEQEELDTGDQRARDDAALPRRTPEETDLRAEGCICPDPLRLNDGAEDPTRDEACTVPGHGFPF